MPKAPMQEGADRRWRDPNADTDLLAWVIPPRPNQARAQLSMSAFRVGALASHSSF